MLAYSPFSSAFANRMSSKKSEVSLVSFFIFNSQFGPKEGEEKKKILYYYPPTPSQLDEEQSRRNDDKQIRAVGLCEAVLNFSSTFTEKDTEAIHTQKARQLFFQPETKYWLIMTINIPSSEKLRDEVKVIEYHEDDVQDSVYLTVLQQAYQMFKLFNGTIGSIFKKGGVNLLRERFKHFFNNYLQTVRLPQADVLDVFSGIHFLPLDKNTYLRIQSFVNLLEASFPAVQQTAFLYNDQLVWSGLEQEDMRIMFRYLTNSLLPAQLEEELTESLTISHTNNSLQFGRFILGPPKVSDESNMGKIPQVYVQTENSCEMCHLLVYRALSATVCVLISGNTQINFKLLKELDKFLGPRTSKLASEISEQYSNRPVASGEAQYKYVYFNQMNLAAKSTMHSESTRAASLPPAIMLILADLNHDFSTSPNVKDGETFLKATSDCWVVGKKSDQREFYVVLNDKNANLTTINGNILGSKLVRRIHLLNRHICQLVHCWIPCILLLEEVKKLCASHFKNIFFLD